MTTHTFERQINNIFKAPNFSFLEGQCNGTKGAEEYCWAITHLAGGGYVAADQIALFLSLDFVWTPFLYTCV